MKEIVVNQEVVAVNRFAMTSGRIYYRPAAAGDLPRICRLLSAEKLPVSDIRNGVQQFFIAEDHDELVGNIGMERYSDIALLRSMVVSPGHRSHGIAGKLIEQLVNHAKEERIQTLYLITNTAEEYFRKRGFNKITRDEVEGNILSSPEFNGLCPASSVIMKRELAYYG